MNEEKFIAYYRVSTKMQEDSGLGLKAQIEEVHRFIKKHGGVLVAEFEEVISGSKNNRPQLMKAIDLAKREDATILTAKMDRLSRNLHFATTLMNEGVKFESADFPFAHPMVKKLMVMIGEHERDLIAQRVRDSLKQTDKPLGAANPAIAKHMPEARVKSHETRRRNFLDYCETQRCLLESLLTHHNYVEVASKFNEMGIKKFRGEGKWYPDQIRNMALKLKLKTASSYERTAS